MNTSAEFSPRELIASADAILGVDVDSGHEFVVYGREFLKGVAAGGEPEPARLLRIELDLDTDDLERLVALVTVLRGRHDYPGGEEEYHRARALPGHPAPRTPDGVLVRTDVSRA